MNILTLYIQYIQFKEIIYMIMHKCIHMNDTIIIFDNILDYYN